MLFDGSVRLWQLDSVQPLGPGDVLRPASSPLSREARETLDSAWALKLERSGRWLLFADLDGVGAAELLDQLFVIAGDEERQGGLQEPAARGVARRLGLLGRELRLVGWGGGGRGQCQLCGTLADAGVSPKQALRAQHALLAAHPASCLPAYPHAERAGQGAARAA